MPRLWKSIHIFSAISIKILKILFMEIDKPNRIVHMEAQKILNRQSKLEQKEQTEGLIIFFGGGLVFEFRASWLQNRYSTS
jgi:hypothetical protein